MASKITPPVTATVVKPTASSSAGGKSTQQDLAGFNYDECKCAEPPADPQVLAGLYDRNVAHKACVDAKTANTVGLGWKFMPKDGADKEEASQMGKVLTKWLEKCSRKDQKTFDDILCAARKDEEAVGWAAIELSRDGKGMIDGFYHVHAYTIRRRVDKDGWVQKVEGKYTYFRNYGLAAKDTKDPKRFTDTNEILVIGEDSPSSAFYPVPDHFPALGDMLGDEAAQAYQLQFFKNNAVPRVIIIVEGGKLDDVTKQVVIEHFRENIQGEAHKTLILETATGSETKIHIEKMTIGEREDASFMEYRRWARDTVIMAHRVSPSKVTIVDNANLANSKDQDKTFKEQVIKPDQNRYEKRIQWILEDEFTEDILVKFRFEEMDLADRLQIAQTDAYYMPAMTNNEVRELHDMRAAGIDETGAIIDQALVDWGTAPYEVGMAPMAWGGTGSSTPTDQSQVGIASTGVTKFAPQHRDFVMMARQLGVIIERIEELEGPREAEPVEKNEPIPELVVLQESKKDGAPQVRLEKGAIQVGVTMPPPNGNGKAKKSTTRKEFVLGEGNLITGVIETKVEE